jgi:hypothetical protein
MPFRHAIIDTDAPSCGVVVCPAVTGRPTSAVERVLIRDHRPVDALHAYDLATVLDRFGYGLWFAEGYAKPMPFSGWLDSRDPRLYAVIVEDSAEGPLHWIGCWGSWLCDGLTTGGRWVRRYSGLGRWSVKAAYAVTPR